MAAEAQRVPSVRERKSFAARLRRFIIAAEPWYDWGEIHVERMEELGQDERGNIVSGGEGPVRYFQIQWLGVHFGIQLGRTPKPLAAPTRPAPRFPAPVGSLAASFGGQA